MYVETVKLLAADRILAAQLVEQGPGLGFFLPKSRQIEHAYNAGATGAIDDLLTLHIATAARTE